MDSDSANHATDNNVLLRAIAHDLRLPLLQIKSKLELLDQSAQAADVKDLTYLTSSGLRQVEAYLKSFMLQEEELPLVPVAIGAILEDVAQDVTPYARQYATKLEVRHDYRKPVLAHIPTMKLAFTCLAESLVRMQASQVASDNYRLTLGAHRLSGHMATGIYGTIDGLSNQLLRSARRLAGRAPQPLPAAAEGISGGILIADSLLAALGLRLRSSQHFGHQGLAVNLQTTTQMSLL